MVAIPQSMSYAIIAGVNPIYGLYTAIVPAIVGALLGSSRHMVTGPTNGNALVTAAVLISLSSKSDYVEYIFLLAILSGVIQLVLGVLRLGNIIRYVSNSVLTGFLTGASILIIVNQLGNIFGIYRPIGESTAIVLKSQFQGLPNTNLYVLGISTFSLLILTIGNHFTKRFPIHGCVTLLPRRKKESRLT
jgi:SulP family sulfate permease